MYILRKLPWLILIVLSGCSVTADHTPAEHSFDEVYETVNNQLPDRNVAELRRALIQQLTSRTTSAPGSHAVPVADPDIYWPVTILERKVQGRDAAREDYVEWRLYKKGGFRLQ